MLQLDLIKNKIEEVGIAPIYFIGSGFSRRYFNAPDFRGLLELIRNDWDRSFQHYLQKNNSNFPMLAEELCDMYFDKMNDNELEENKERNYYFKKRVSKLLEEMFSSNISQFDNNKEIQLLKQTSPSAIITTNYDRFLEHIFPNFEPYIGQKFLLSHQVSAVGEIYKIHGCVTDPSSIVITQTDYEEFQNKSLYLNAKLMTMFLEYPIVIMGYSLEDANIKNVLTDIVKMLPADKVDELKERIFFIRRNKKGNDYTELERFSLQDGLYIDLRVFYVNDFSVIYQTIISTKVQKLPINFLRYLKSNIYKLTASQEYNPKLLNVNITDLERIDDFKSTHNIIGLTFSADPKGAKDLLDIKDIIQPILQQDEVCPYTDASIKFIIKEHQQHLPINYYVSQKGSQDDFIRYVNSLKNLKKSNKEAVIKKVQEGKDYSAILGKVFEINVKGIIDLEISVKSINSFIDEYCILNDVPQASRTSVLRHLLVLIITNRLNELIESDQVLLTLRDFILECITNLEVDFIKINRNQILVLMKKLDNQHYDARFRKAICHIDQVLFSYLYNGKSKQKRRNILLKKTSTSKK